MLSRRKSPRARRNRRYRFVVWRRDFFLMAESLDLSGAFAGAPLRIIAAVGARWIKSANPLSHCGPSNATFRCNRGRLFDWSFPYVKCQTFPLPAGHVDRYSETAPAGSVECTMASLSFQMQLGTSAYSRATLVYQADVNDVRSAVRRSALLATIEFRWYLRCASRHDREATSRGGVRQFVHARPGGRYARPGTGVCEASFFGCVLPQGKKKCFRARAPGRHAADLARARRNCSRRSHCLY